MNIAIPSAKIDLGITDANQQWIITAYSLAFGSLLLLGGRIGDFMGRKRIFIIGLLGFAGASALGGIATSQELLFAARALQGVFGELLAPAALAINSVTFTVSSEPSFWTLWCNFWWRRSSRALIKHQPDALQIPRSYFFL